MPRERAMRGAGGTAEAGRGVKAPIAWPTRCAEDEDQNGSATNSYTAFWVADGGASTIFSGRVAREEAVGRDCYDQNGLRQP